MFVFCSLIRFSFVFFFFFFNDTATTEIYTLSLHDALPISKQVSAAAMIRRTWGCHPSNAASARAMVARSVQSSRFHISCSVQPTKFSRRPLRDRKSTRLNSSHTVISYAVFCLKKKKRTHRDRSSPPSCRPGRTRGWGVGCPSCPGLTGPTSPQLLTRTCISPSPSVLSRGVHAL